MSNYEVSQLPPTLGIKDPEVKSFLDALVNAWDQRSGNIDSEDRNRFITKGEFSELANKAVLSMFSGGGDGGAAAGLGAGSGSDNSTVRDVISRISDEIKKTYLYNLLGTEFDSVNIKEMNAKIDDVVSATGAAFVQERNQRASDIEAVTRSISAQASRIDDAISAVASESDTRATKDTALARAINTIWVNVGGDSALIQDGALASVTPSATSASKWDQVQAAVTDPNTGQVSSTSIKQDLNSYINKTDGTLRSTWSVRVEAQSGGRAIVGGVGLSLTDGGQSGPTIDFGIRADRFWVGDTSGNGDLPFVISGGHTFIKNAMIQDASIDNAKIRDLAVDTVKIAGESVTSMAYQEGGSGTIVAGWGDYLVTVYKQMPVGSSGVVLNGFVLLAGNGAGATVSILIGKTPIGDTLGGPSSVLLRSAGVSVIGGFYSSFAVTAFDPNPSGLWSYWLATVNPTTGPGSNVSFSYSSPSLTVIGGKR